MHVFAVPAKAGTQAVTLSDTSRPSCESWNWCAGVGVALALMFVLPLRLLLLLLTYSCD
jgi:hypothetical protein